MDGSEDSLFKIVGTTMKHFATYVYLKALQAGESIRLRVYNKVDNVSHFKFDGTLNDSVGTNNGTLTNVASFQDWLKFDGDILETIGSNTWAENYDTRLKAIYKFEGNLNDSTSGAHNLTVAGTEVYATGREGQCFSFNGSTGLSASDAILPNGNNAWSIAFWINPSVVDPYIGSWGSAGAGNDVEFFVASGKLNVGTYGTGNILVSNNSVPLNRWTHIVITFDGSNIRASFNGVQDSLASHTYAIVRNSLYLGTFYNISAYATMLLDEVRIYNSQLDTSQIKALYMNGHANQCHAFDGAEYINTTYSPTSLTSSDFSISFWHKTPDNTSVVENDNSRIFADNSGNFFIRIRPRAEAFNTIEMFLNKSGGIIFDRISNTYVPDIWHHEVYVWDNTAKTLAQYEDGVFKSSVSVGATLAAMSNPTFIGLSNYVGQLDDFRIFSSKLTAGQIAGLYSYTGSNYISPLPVGNSLFLDGSSYVTVQNVAPYNFERTDSFALSSWVNTTSNTEAILTKNSGTGTKGYEVTLNASGKVQIRIVNTASTNEINVVDSGAAVNDGNWHNIIVTYAGTSAASGVALYVDGSARTLTTTTDNLSATIKNSNNVTFGAHGNATQKFTGLIDDVQIYKYVPTLQEIAIIYAGKFANYHYIGYWNLDGNLYDTSGHGSTGIITGTETYYTGAISGSANTPNTCFNSDGSQFITLSNTTNIPIGNSDRTVTFWVFANKFDNLDIMFYIGGNTNGVFGAFWTSTASTSTMTLWGQGNDKVSSTVFNLNTWYHIAITLSNNGTVRNLYVNGTLDANFPYTSTPLVTQSGNFYIGAFTNSTDNFIGRIDDFRIYNRALSAAEISDLYTYPDSAMKQLIYDKTYSGVKSDAVYIPMLQGNQYMVTAQQTSGTNRIVTWERSEVT